MSALGFRALDSADLAALQATASEVLSGVRLYVQARPDEASLSIRASMTYSTDVTITEESLAEVVDDVRALLTLKAREAAEAVRVDVERAGMLAGAERLVELAKRGTP